MSAPNGDKRSVSTDALETLGTIIDDTQKRDAIHLAVIPVVAGTDMKRGSDVYIDSALQKAFIYDEAAWKNNFINNAKPIGIVDPFLTADVKEGEMFWLVIYPRKITSLRHVWSHPDIPDDEEIRMPVTVKVDDKAIKAQESEDWLRTFCSTADCPEYEILIEALRTGAIEDKSGYGEYHFRWDNEYLYFGGMDAHGEIPKEFWEHVGNVLGYKIEESQRAEYFSCSC